MNNLLNIFEDYAFNKMANNGLVLFPLPTGTGKSTSIFQFIYKTLKENKHQEKILFVTSLKKNLQVDEIAQIFKKNGDEKLFNDKVLVLKSYYDYIIENLPKLIKDNLIPKEILDLSEMIKLKDAIDICISQSENNKELLERVQKEIRTSLEKDFRFAINRKIINDLKNHHHIKKITREAKLDYIQKKMRWLLDLYPQILINEKQVYLMSMDKFLVQTDTLIEAPFYNYKKLAKKAIIFIDEFDSTKETVLNHLINNANNNSIDYISAFKTIHDRLNYGDFPTDLTTPSKRSLERRQQGASLISGELNILKEQNNKLFSKYHLNYIFKNRNLDSQVFLFQDIHNILIQRKDKSYNIFYTPNDITRTNDISIDGNESQGSFNLMSVLREISGYLNYFSTGIYMLASNYCELKLEQDMDFELKDAIASVLDTFFLENKNYKNFFMDRILLYNNKNKETRHSLKFDGSFFENGFSFYTIEDDDTHDFRSIIKNTKLESTPEKILLEVCKEAKVFGISATANYDSLIGNYALRDYIIPKLGANYYQLNTEDRKILEANFNKSICNYDDVDIKVKKIDTSLDYSKESWEDFGKSNMERFFNIVEQQVSSIDDKCNYFAKRYLRIAKVFKEFLNTEDLLSFLCLLSLFPKENNPEFDINVLEIIFNSIAQSECNNDQYSFKNNVVILRSSSTYEVEKKNLEKRLANGEKILVISTYATLGAGQNLQYEIPTKIKDKVIHINNYPKRNLRN